MTRPRPPTAKKAYSSLFAFAKPQKASPPFAGAAPSENADGRVNSELAWRKRTQRQKEAKSDRIVFPAFLRALRKYFLLAPPSLPNDWRVSTAGECAAEPRARVDTRPIQEKPRVWEEGGKTRN